jgi:hypothetical protein
LQEYARDLESQLRRGDLPPAKELDTLHDAAMATFSAIAIWLDNNPLEERLAEPGAGDLRARLNELERLLELVDGRSLAVAEEIRNLLPSHLPAAIDDSMNQLITAMHGFDFDTALTLFKVLRDALEEHLP